MFFKKKGKKSKKNKGNEEKKEKISIKEKIIGGKLHVIIIIEVAGRPEEYIKKAGFEIKNRSYHIWEEFPIDDGHSHKILNVCCKKK